QRRSARNPDHSVLVTRSSAENSGAKVCPVIGLLQSACGMQHPALQRVPLPGVSDVVAVDARKRLRPLEGAAVLQAVVLVVVLLVEQLFAPGPCQPTIRYAVGVGG